MRAPHGIDASIGRPLEFAENEPVVHASIELIYAMAGAWANRGSSKAFRSFCGAPWMFGHFVWADASNDVEVDCVRCSIAMDAAREGVVLASD